MPFHAEAQLNKQRPQELEGVDLTEKLGETIPPDAKFTTSAGNSVTLGELMEPDKPVLLTPVYYECPLLCGLILEGVFNAVDELKWTPGKDYTIISISIDPEEEPSTAASTKERVIADLNQPETAGGWYFLTGSESEIMKVTESVGFSYAYDENEGEYVHPASIIFISPGGTITRYLYGIEFSEFDFRNALFEAADGKIGSAVDKAVMYCFSYDPASNSYVPVAINIMKLGGLATVLFLGIFLSLFWFKERRSSHSQKLNLRNEQT